MQSFLSDFADVVTENEPLAPLTYFGLGGPARWMARPRSVAQLSEIVRRCRAEGITVKVLGLGANLLVSDDGVDGVVIRLNDKGFRTVEWETDRDLLERPARGPDPDGVAVRVGGGFDMSRLTLDSVRRGLDGIGCMAGIPGTLGGIIRMNAGGRFGQIADVVCDITVVHPSGEVRRLTHDEIGFSYRRTALDGAIVSEAILVLRPDDPQRVRTRYTEIWDYKKKSQPLADYSAGCVFKNPPGRSAGRLIDEAGLKGHGVGGAYVSPHHANFIVAKEGATARDVIALIGQVRRTVADCFGVELELELEVWESRQARQRPTCGAGCEA